MTIPDSIRKIVGWANPSAVVSISVVKPDEIVIKPHKKNYDWDKIWEGVKKARAIKGTGQAISTVDFLQEDRASH